MNGDKFKYNYCAPTESERKEILSIRRQYEQGREGEKDKLAELRKLDAAIKRPALIVSLITGIFGCLIFGSGIAAVLEFGRAAVGTAASAVGCAAMIFAYPLHKSVLKRSKAKHGEEILRACEFLLGDKKKD